MQVLCYSFDIGRCVLLYIILVGKVIFVVLFDVEFDCYFIESMCVVFIVNMLIDEVVLCVDLVFVWVLGIVWICEEQMFGIVGIGCVVVIDGELMGVMSVVIFFVCVDVKLEWCVVELLIYVIIQLVEL